MEIEFSDLRESSIESQIKKGRTLQKAYITKTTHHLSPASRGHYSTLEKVFNGQDIVNPNIIKIIIAEDTLYSPFARPYAKRKELAHLKKVRKVLSLPANAFSEYVELPPETLLEKQLRKAQERAYFLSLNKVDFSTYKNLEEREAAYWVSFWNYIAMEKVKVLNNERSKIRPEELEDIAKAGPLQHYQSFEVGGTLFYYHLDFLDFFLKDSFDRTNAQRLKAGLNPIGIDGLSMEIHHLTMFDDSILVLLSRTAHEGGPLKRATSDVTATFHPQPTYYGRGRNSDIDRTTFAKIATSACIKLGEMAPENEYNDELDCFFDDELLGDDESGIVFLEGCMTSSSPILKGNDEEGTISYISTAGTDSFVSAQSIIPSPHSTIFPEDSIIRKLF